MSSVDQQDKCVIVTGANCGIGFEATKELCRLGCDVVISVRDEDKGKSTVAAIAADVPDAKVMYLIMELGEPESIKTFVESFHKTGKQLNVLLNNAGIFPSYAEAVRTNARGDPDLELAMTVNCMGTFLLTNLLLDDLKKTGTPECPSRIVNVSSGMVTSLKPEWRFDIENIMLSKPGTYTSGAQAYRCSKVALNLWSNELAKKLSDSNVIINTVCPGFIPSTNLTRNVPSSFTLNVMLKIFDSFVGRYLMRTQPKEVGMRRLVNLTVGEMNTSGVFYKDDKPQAEPSEVLDRSNQQKIWDICVKYSKLDTK